MKTIIGCATYPGDSYIGGCQGLHQMPRAAPKVRWWAVLRPREVLRPHRDAGHRNQCALSRPPEDGVGGMDARHLRFGCLAEHGERRECSRRISASRIVKSLALAKAKGRPGAMPSDLGTNCRSAPVPFIT
jgi:hypothetical protein